MNALRQLLPLLFMFCLLGVGVFIYEPILDDHNRSYQNERALAVYDKYKDTQGEYFQDCLDAEDWEEGGIDAEDVFECMKEDD